MEQKTNYNDSESCKIRIREENKIKQIQFPLYLERCKFIYNSYINKELYTFIQFWNYNLKVNNITDADLNKSSKQIYNHNNQEKNKEFFYLTNHFTTSFKSIYTKAKILQGIKDTAPNEKIPSDIITAPINHENNCAWNSKNLGVGLALANRLIKGKITTTQFIEADLFTGQLSKKTINPPTPNPREKSGMKAKNKKQLSFTQFNLKYFAGEKMGELNTDTTYSKKLALSFYSEYIKSGLTYTKYNDTTINEI